MDIIFYIIYIMRSRMAIIYLTNPWFGRTMAAIGDTAVLTLPSSLTTNEARKHLEAIRWPDGPVCPHCGAIGDHYRLEGKGGKEGTKARRGLLQVQGLP